jgi:hypothetical protein
LFLRLVPHELDAKVIAYAKIEKAQNDHLPGLDEDTARLYAYVEETWRRSGGERDRGAREE